MISIVKDSDFKMKKMALTNVFKPQKYRSFFKIRWIDVEQKFVSKLRGIHDLYDVHL